MMDSFKDLSGGCTLEASNPYDSLIIDSKSDPVSRRVVLIGLTYLW